MYINAKNIQIFNFNSIFLFSLTTYYFKNGILLINKVNL